MFFKNIYVFFNICFFIILHKVNETVTNFWIMPVMAIWNLELSTRIVREVIDYLSKNYTIF